MEREQLKKVQGVLLDILKEVRRVCDENGIRYFLCCGTFLGAVRHQGFIPWDDDLDIGMLREDYERFCAVAPGALGEGFCLQSWYTDENYGLPFAKVRMKNTLYQEAKRSRYKENGFFIDIFPFDYAPEDAMERQAYMRKLNTLFRLKLMKAGARPWIERDRINWKKRLGYGVYQLWALLRNSESLSREYDALAASRTDGSLVCRQRGLTWLDCFDARLYRELASYPFEGEFFPGPGDFDAVLRVQFGDYMVLPPENEREDRHQIVRVEFPPEKKMEEA